MNRVHPVVRVLAGEAGFEPTHDGATIRCVNHFTIFAMLSMAGAVGIEPTLTVLETGVLPLYDAPN